jgi:hypothetical protein
LSFLRAMILSLGRDSSSRRSFVICLGTSIDEVTLLSKAKVKPGTYAGELIANLYDEIFHRSLELKRDYAEYYALEYGSFGEYIRKRFLFSPELVSNIGSQFLQSSQIIYFQPSQYFLEEDYGLDFLERLLEPRSDV